MHVNTLLSSFFVLAENQREMSTSSQLMWNRKGWELSHSKSLLRLYYAEQEATTILDIQWDHNSPATSTDSKNVLNVK